jgi:hypothetical protein
MGGASMNGQSAEAAILRQVSILVTGHFDVYEVIKSR